MAINAECPHCGTLTKVHERFAGTSGPCRNCDQTMSVPTAEGVDVNPAAVPIPSRVSTTPPSQGRFRANRNSPIPGCLLLIFMTKTVFFVAIRLMKKETVGWLFYWIAFMLVMLVLAVGTWLNKRGMVETNETRRQILEDQIDKRNANRK